MLCKKVPLILGTPISTAVAVMVAEAVPHLFPCNLCISLRSQGSGRGRNCRGLALRAWAEE